MAYKLDLQFLNNLDSFIEDIPVEDLEVDPSIQRPLDPYKVSRLVKEFTPAGVGTLAVSRRIKPIRNIVLDGQHRHAALLRLISGGGPAKVRCEVFENLSKGQEAALFLTLNNTTKPRAVDKFRVAVEAGESTALAVMELLKAYDIPLATYPSPRQISAVDVMRRIYEKSEKQGYEPNTLQLVLLTVKHAWNGSDHGYAGIMLSAIGSMYDEYGDNLVVTEFVARLGDHKPLDLILEGRHHASVKQVLPAMGLAEVLVGKYNVDARGRRRTGKSRLWDWGRRR